MSQLILEHQHKETAADGTSARQTVFRPQDHFGRESEYLSVNRSADHRRHIIVFSHKGTGNDNIVPRFGAALWNAFAGSVNFPPPHERACSAINARAWRASRLRCLRNRALSLASVFRWRSLSAYCRSAVRTRAVGLLRLDEASVSSSRSFEVASSIAISFIRAIIAAV